MSSRFALGMADSGERREHSGREVPQVSKGEVVGLKVQSPSGSKCIDRVPDRHRIVREQRVEAKGASRWETSFGF